MAAVTFLGIVPNMPHTHLWTLPLTYVILDYSVIHVSKMGNYIAMEEERLRRCFDKLFNPGVDTISVATDRHTYWCSLLDEKMLPSH